MEYWEAVKIGALFLCGVVCLPLALIGYLITEIDPLVEAVIEDWDWTT